MRISPKASLRLMVAVVGGGTSSVIYIRKMAAFTVGDSLLLFLHA